MGKLPFGYAKRFYPFLVEYAPGHYIKDIVEELNMRFGEDLTFSQVQSMLERFNIHTGMHGKAIDHWNRIMTPEIMQWLKDHQWTHNNKEAAEELRRLYGDRITYQVVTNWRRKYNLVWRQWNPMMVQYLMENYQTKTSQEIADYLNKTYNKHLTRPAITAYLSERGLLKGQPYMKRRPNNIRKVGTERLRHGHQGRNNYWEVKTEQGWRPKSHIMWEQYHGQPVTKEYNVVFLDGNINNFSEDNLKLVLKKAMGIVNSRYKIEKGGDKDMNELKFNIATLDYFVSQEKKAKSDEPVGGVR